MRQGKDLINKPIYSIDEGRLLGKVQDLYVDESLEAILGLFLGSQGLVRRKSELVRAADIVVLGADAVLVKNAASVTDDNAVPAAKGWLRREKLAGREIDTPGGTRLGVLGDISFDDTGRVSGFMLSKTYVAGPLAEKRYVDRTAIVDTGQEDGRMTVDLPKLEALLGDMPELATSEISGGEDEVIAVQIDDAPGEDPKEQ